VCHEYGYFKGGAATIWRACAPRPQAWNRHCPSRCGRTRCIKLTVDDDRARCVGLAERVARTARVLAGIVQFTRRDLQRTDAHRVGHRVPRVGRDVTLLPIPRDLHEPATGQLSSYPTRDRLLQFTRRDLQRGCRVAQSVKCLWPPVAMQMAQGLEGRSIQESSPGENENF